MLTILVCGPKQPSDLIDVYLRPLVDDLKTLWKPGVKEVWDEFKHEHFTLHGMLFTTINDIPAHRNLSGQSKRKGEACPHYLDETCSLWLRNSKKFVFMGHRRFLHKKHPYGNMDGQFDGRKENRTAPPYVCGMEVHLQVKDIKTMEELSKKTILGKRKKWDGEEDVQGTWKKKSILWELEYWELLDVRHSIDNMHVKKKSVTGVTTMPVMYDTIHRTLNIYDTYGLMHSHSDKHLAEITDDRWHKIFKHSQKFIFTDLTHITHIYTHHTNTYIIRRNTCLESVIWSLVGTQTWTKFVCPIHFNPKCCNCQLPPKPKASTISFFSCTKS